VEALVLRRMREALVASRGNQARAARWLGIPRRTFVRKLRQHRETLSGDGLDLRARAMRPV
jgi:transcriptional regulator of acetoin/glycerol metabolism